MNNFPMPNIAGCSIYGVDGLTLFAKCDNRYLNRTYANMCDKIYYADGKLECIPKGSYKEVCQNIRIEGNELKALCKDGRKDPVTVYYDMNNWKGDHITYVNGKLT